MLGVAKPPALAGVRKRGMKPTVMFLWAVGVCLVLAYWLDLFAPSAPVTVPGVPGKDVSALRRAAVKFDPELVSSVPTTFLPVYASPCWKANGTLHCLPAFYLLGGFQSAQNHLWSMLRKHPRVLNEGPSQPQFWAEADKKWSWLDKEYSPILPKIETNPQLLLGDASESTYAYYASANGRLHTPFAKQLQAAHKDCPPVGDAKRQPCMVAAWGQTHKAVTQAAAELGLAPHDLSTPLLMRAVYGQRPPKLVAVLRAPTARLHAAYHLHPHYHEHFKDSGGIQNYSSTMINAMTDCIGKYGDKACATMFELLEYQYEKVWFHADQLLRGMHSVWVGGWLEYFGDNLLVVFMDELQDDPRGTMDRVVQHLGLGPLNETVWKEMEAGQAPEPGLQPATPLPPAVEQALGQFYSRYNTGLGQLLFGTMTCPWSQQLWKTGAWQAGRGAPTPVVVTT